MPANVSRRATHSGDGPIETGEITVAANRSHSSGDSTTTDALGPSSVLATFGVFFVMAMLYRARIVRNSPKFTKIMIATIGGLFAAMLINFVLSLFGFHTGLRDNGPLGYIFSIVCIVVAALSFIVDFDQIEQGVRAGLPQRYSWTCAFGILVGLIWLYLEILRLLSYLQGSSRD